MLVLASFWPVFHLAGAGYDPILDHRRKSQELLQAHQRWPAGVWRVRRRRSLRVPPVIFMFVKKASDLLLQLRRLACVTQKDGVFEKLPLDGSRQIIPLQERRRSKALQDTLLSL